jgi:hypothetical protein
MYPLRSRPESPAALLLRHFETGNTVKTRLTETPEREDFQHVPRIPGLESVGEQELLALLKALHAGGRITRSEEVCDWDSGEYRVIWTS